MYVRPQMGDTTLSEGRMAEQPATNPNRPALYRVAAGSILTGARVEILGTADQKPLNTLRPTDRVAVRECTDYPRPDQQLRDATVLWRNLERVWRTKDEEALGREFTEEEAAEHERGMRLRVARHVTKHRAESSTASLGRWQSGCIAPVRKCGGSARVSTRS